MADYYLQFSEAFNVTAEEEEWIKEFLKTECPTEKTDKEIAAWCKVRGLSKDSDTWNWPHFEWCITGKGKDRSCWIYSNDGYDEEHLAGFIQAYLRKFHPDTVITISGAETCSKPRIDSFGGFWLAITAKRVEGGSTWDAARVAAERLKKKLLR